MGTDTIIIIMAYGYTRTSDPAGVFDIPKWEEDIVLKELLGRYGLILNKDELDIISDSLSNANPIKDERWHYVTMKRVEINHGLQEPHETYYEILNVSLEPMQCEQCGKYVDEKDYELSVEYGQNVYCSQYCSEIANGVPLPYSQSVHNFLNIQDKICNGLSNL